MKHIKITGLTVLAALIALASTASASILTSSGFSAYTSTIAATAGATSLHGNFVTVTCKKSSVSGNVESHGGAVMVSGFIKTLAFTECNYPVTIKKKGSLSLEGITGGSNGFVRSSGLEVEIKTSIADCIFTTSYTFIGLLTGGSPATFDIAASIPRTDGSIFCGSTGQWTGSYNINTPGSLYADP